MLCILSINWGGFCGYTEIESWTFLAFLCRLFPSSSWMNSVCVCESLSEWSLSCMVPLYFPLCGLTSSLRALSFMCLCLSVAGWPCEIALHTSLLFPATAHIHKESRRIDPCTHACTHTHKSHLQKPQFPKSSSLHFILPLLGGSNWIKSQGKVTRKLLRGQYWLRTRETFSQLDKL